MEKYGVEQVSLDRDKTASSDATVCRSCGGRLAPVADTNVLKCITCGTLPYEVPHASR